MSNSDLSKNNEIDILANTLQSKKAYFDGSLQEYKIAYDSKNCLIELNQKRFIFKIIKKDKTFLTLIDANQKRYCLHVLDESSISINSKRVEFSKRKVQSISDNHNVGSLVTPMPGKILKVYVKEGESVKTGQKLFTMEAMKMEHTIKSDRDSVVIEISNNEGDQVDVGIEVVKLELEKAN